MEQAAPVLDIESYFLRIGYDGPREPTLATLKALHLHHPLAIPFENLDPFLHRPVKLDLAALQEKLVWGKRGGYCFEQNLLFMAVLRALGFRVTGLAARVLWNRPEDAPTPRTHMLLRIDFPNGAWIADVGFGGLTLTAPLRLQPGLLQETPHETFRLDGDGDGFRMLALAGGKWRTLYRFGLEEQFQVDYEITNYYLAHSPASHFRNSLIAARPVRNGRYALLNARLNVYGDVSDAPRDLASVEEIETVLRTIFGIAVPDVANLARALQRESLL